MCVCVCVQRMRAFVFDREASADRHPSQTRLELGPSLWLLAQRLWIFRWGFATMGKKQLSVSKHGQVLLSHGLLIQIWDTVTLFADVQGKADNDNDFQVNYALCLGILVVRISSATDQIFSLFSWRGRLQCSEKCLSAVFPVAGDEALMELTWLISGLYSNTSILKPFFWRGGKLVQTLDDCSDVILNKLQPFSRSCKDANAAVQASRI